MTPPHSPLSVGSQSHDYRITRLSYPEQRCSFIAHAVIITVALAFLEVLTMLLLTLCFYLLQYGSLGMIAKNVGYYFVF